MEAPNSLKRRISVLEATIPDDSCQTCAARPVFTMADNGATGTPCAECGRQPEVLVFSIAIDRLDTEPGDAA